MKTTQKSPPGAPASVISIAKPVIRQLTIERFRGIKSLARWNPAEGVNILLGGGDVGKTTILEAIGLLLSPTNPSILSDTDYYGRDIAAGFSIEAVIALPPDSGIDHQYKPSWPWHWDGQQAVVPHSEHESLEDQSCVYRVRVCGNQDLELKYEIVQPDGSADSFSVSLRRAIGLVRLAGDDRNDRDLRLVQGSALDRLIGDKNLRSRMARELSKSKVKDLLTPEALQELTHLDAVFLTEKLPNGLELALTGSPGASVAAMVGLTATSAGTQLPLASWGAGTRRLAALVIAERHERDVPITAVDEIERGLEPYRQRLLIERLQADEAQTFITTHSPTVIAAASASTFWYMDHAGHLGCLDSEKIARHRETDPVTFLSRLAIINEGATEVGFTRALLERAIGAELLRHGIHLSDGRGHEATLELIEALSRAKLRFGCFADDEGKYPERWKAVEGGLVFRWKSGCLEENIVAAILDDKIEALITDPLGENTGDRLRTLADRLGMSGEDKSFASIRANAGEHLKALILDAALGRVPVGKESEKKKYRSHERMWWKSEAGGQELLDKTFELGLWPSLKTELLPFCNAVREVIDLAPIQEIAT